MKIFSVAVIYFFPQNCRKKKEKEGKRKIWIITLNYVTIFKQCWLLWWKRKTFHLCFTKYSKVKKVAFYHCWVLLLSVLSILISFYNLLSSILLRKIGKLLKWSQCNPIKYLNISEFLVTLVISKPVQSIWITENDLYIQNTSFNLTVFLLTF